MSTSMSSSPSHCTPIAPMSFNRTLFWSVGKGDQADLPWRIWCKNSITKWFVGGWTQRKGWNVWSLWKHIQIPTDSLLLPHHSLCPIPPSPLFSLTLPPLLYLPSYPHQHLKTNILPAVKDFSCHTALKTSNQLSLGCQLAASCAQDWLKACLPQWQHLNDLADNPSLCKDMWEMIGTAEILYILIGALSGESCHPLEEWQWEISNNSANVLLLSFYYFYPHWGTLISLSPIFVSCPSYVSMIWGVDWG